MSTANAVKLRLEGVEETLLIPLWARAAETQRWWDPIVKDPRAVELVERIDYDFGKLSWDWMTQLVVAIRTQILDTAVRDFLISHPDALIINLAAGLDTRFYRLDNGRLTWVDVDLPNSMALRRTFFDDDDRHHYVTGSVLEDGWCDAIHPRPGQAVLVIIEGLAMYFREEETRGLVKRLADRFPGAEVLMEFVSPQVAQGSELFFKLRGMSARFRSGLAGKEQLEGWDPRVRFAERWLYADFHPLRWGPLALGRVLSGWREAFGGIVRFTLVPKG